MLRKILTMVLPAITGAVLTATPAVADTLGAATAVLPTVAAVTPAVAAETSEQKAAAERKALMVEAAMSAPTIGAPAPAPTPAAAPAPIKSVSPALVAEATLTQLRHVPAPLLGSVLAAAQKYDLSPLLIDAVARQESGYRVNAVSRMGAIGVMQLMPGTARMMGVHNPRDPHANIDGGARYLRRLIDRFGGNVALALAAYNAGPARVERAGGVPRIAETQNYVTKILGRLAAGAAAATQAVVHLAAASAE